MEAICAARVVMRNKGAPGIDAMTALRNAPGFPPAVSPKAPAPLQATHAPTDGPPPRRHTETNDRRPQPDPTGLGRATSASARATNSTRSTAGLDNDCTACCGCNGRRDDAGPKNSDA